MVPWSEAKPMKASKPKAIWSSTHQTGRPLLSTYAMNLGAMPRSAMAWMVLVEPKVQELATEMTARVMTALKMEGRTLIPASWIASTKGDALVLAPEAPSSLESSERMIRPTMNRLTT